MHFCLVMNWLKRKEWIMESDVKITPKIIQRITEMQNDEKMYMYIDVIDQLIDLFTDEGHFVDGENVVEGGYAKILFILRMLTDMKKDFLVLNNNNYDKKQEEND